MESENELDKKRIVERFETELNSVTEYFKRQVQDVRSDFEEEIRQMQKMRARDKSDADNSFKDLDKQLTVLQEDLTKYQDYFSCCAQSISIITENINMQMESEFADLFDRKLISLYGVKNKKPTRMD